MSHWREVHRRGNPDFLFAEDIGAPGTTLVVQIDKVIPKAKMRAAGSNTGEMPACTFVGSKSGKKLGLNRTNCKVLETMSGSSDSERWAGLWIVLTVVRTSYPDQATRTKMETDAIRIAPSPPTLKQIDEATARRAGSGRQPRAAAPTTASIGGGMSPDEIAEIERIEREESR